MHPKALSDLPVTAPAEQRNNLAEKPQESSVVFTVFKDRLLAVAASRDVIKGAGLLNSEGAGHDLALQQCY